MNRRNFLFLPVAWFVCGCSSDLIPDEEPRTTKLTLHVAGRGNAASLPNALTLPSSYDEFDCLLVNVIGSDILGTRNQSEVDAFLEHQATGGNCGYLGVYSQPVPLPETAAAAIELEVSPGTGRVVQLLGIVEGDSGVCGLDPPGVLAAIEDREAEAYVLDRETIDLDSDRELAMQVSFGSLGTLQKIARMIQCDSNFVPMITEDFTTGENERCVGREREASITEGSGTAEDPYIICGIDAWNSAASNPAYASAHLSLGNDLDFTGQDFSQFGAVSSFSGVLMGEGHSLSNISHGVTGPGSGGIISVMSGTNASARDLVIQSATFTAENGALGTVVGVLENGTIENVRVSSATLSGNSHVGGLVGTTIGSGEILRSGASTTITTTSRGGGLVGLIQPASPSTFSIRESYALGTATGSGVDTYMGGLIGGAAPAPGDTSTLTVVDTYARVDITGGPGVGCGGLIGELNPQSTSNFVLTRSYNASSIACSGDSGGVAGRVENESAIDESEIYWVYTPNAAGYGSLSGTKTGLGLLQNTGFAGWSSDTWSTADGSYPTLVNAPERSDTD